MAPSGWLGRARAPPTIAPALARGVDAAVRRFEQSDAAERAAFLRRSGVRRCVLPETDSRQWRTVAEVPDWKMRVFECNPGAARAVIASYAEVTAAPSDPGWQREALFVPALRDDVARMAAMPAAAGKPGPPEPPFGRIVADGGPRVVLQGAA